MNVALFNVVIMIQKRDVTTDDLGNHVSTWHDFYKCHATISAESGSVQAADGTKLETAGFDATIRWCAKAAGLKADEARVIFNDEVYTISAIDHMNYKKRSLKLKCEKVKL